MIIQCKTIILIQNKTNILWPTGHYPPIMNKSNFHSYSSSLNIDIYI